MTFKIVYDDGDVIDFPMFELDFYLDEREVRVDEDSCLKGKFIPGDAKLNGR